MKIKTGNQQENKNINNIYDLFETFKNNKLCRRGREEEGEREKEIMIRKQGRLEMGGTRPHKFKS